MKVSNINVNNTNYIIGGEQFDDLKNVIQHNELVNWRAQTNSYEVCSLSNFLPNDNYYYEVTLYCYINTPYSLDGGTESFVTIYGGSVSQDVNTNKGKVCSVFGRTSGRIRSTSGYANLIISPNDKNITVYRTAKTDRELNETSTPARTNITLVSYRKLGINENNVNYQVITYNEFTGDTDNIYSDGETVRDSDGITKTRYLISETNTQEIARLEREKIGDFAILSTDEDTIDYRKLIDGEYANAGIYTKSNNTRNWAVAYRVTN